MATPPKTSQGDAPEADNAAAGTRTVTADRRAVVSHRNAVLASRAESDLKRIELAISTVDKMRTKNPSSYALARLDQTYGVLQSQANSILARLNKTRNASPESHEEHHDEHVDEHHIEDAGSEHHEAHGHLDSAIRHTNRELDRYHSHEAQREQTYDAPATRERTPMLVVTVSIGRRGQPGFRDKELFAETEQNQTATR